MCLFDISLFYLFTSITSMNVYFLIRFQNCTIRDYGFPMAPPARMRRECYLSDLHREARSVLPRELRIKYQGTFRNITSKSWNRIAVWIANQIWGRIEVISKTNRILNFEREHFVFMKKWILDVIKWNLLSVIMGRPCTTFIFQSLLHLDSVIIIILTYFK